jgi:DNA-binding NtrC family response regulator
MRTGSVLVVDDEESIRNTLNEYFTKPFHMDDIQLKVERALNIRKTAAALRKGKSLFLNLAILTPIMFILGILWKGI